MLKNIKIKNNSWELGFPLAKNIWILQNVFCSYSTEASLDFGKAPVLHGVGISFHSICDLPGSWYFGFFIAILYCVMRLDLN